MTGGWHIAQVNVALPCEPLDSPALAGFVANLEPVNALADAAPGFVWRLEDEGGDATSIRPFDDERMIINMSVWESLDALWAFVYDGGHLEVMRRRREWMRHLAEAYMGLWWLPAGELPTVEQAKERLAHLREHGPTPRAFTFKRRFAPPGVGAGDPVVTERDPCPAG
ncbi:MAG: DUF3291 domain-containing protein [Solirubrobacterales bacterium]|nr:DUF3291 domain-containing protein [Solirubrobacterales bacterium]